jgi:hypothetical protein
VAALLTLARSVEESGGYCWQFDRGGTLGTIIGNEIDSVAHSASWETGVPTQESWATVFTHLGALGGALGFLARDLDIFASLSFKHSLHC